MYRKKVTLPKVLLYIAAALVIVYAVMMIIIPASENPRQDGIPGSSHWMDGVPDRTALNDIVLPGTHDSATKNTQLAYFSKCQSLTVGEQLNAGFRYLDIRLGTDGKSERLKLMHGFTSCRTGPWPWSSALYLEDVLEQCYAFLDANPSEAVVFAVKYEHGDASIADVERMLDSYIQKDPSYWLLSDTIPTVGEARKKLVLMRRYNDEAGLGAQAGIPLIWSEQRDNSDVSLNMARENNGTYTLWVQDRFKYGTEDKWNAFKDGLENCRSGGDSLALSFLSTNGSGGYGHPYKYAKALNPRILGGEGLKGWIVIDFATAELAQAIYCNN